MVARLIPGSATNATLAIVETIVHEDVQAEDMPIRRMIDVLMMATVDGKERSQVCSLCCCCLCLPMIDLDAVAVQKKYQWRVDSHCADASRHLLTRLYLVFCSCGRASCTELAAVSVVMEAEPGWWRYAERLAAIAGEGGLRNDGDT